MNISRLSYTLPLHSNYEYSADVILHKCEFCSRTFIPDSLTKHRKVCYRDYLKKKSQKPNLKSRNMGRSKSALAGFRSNQCISLTELMISRQTRRMNWRERHEEFIQTIRSAREHSVSIDNDISSQMKINYASRKENMKQCIYCLRNFHKDSIVKHLTLCKEHSIQSSRLRHDDAHIQAKRRLSLRLYYKPKSFRGDSPDDQTTSISSHDLDSQSMATFDSRSFNNDLSNASVLSTKLSVNVRSRAVSATNSSPKNGKSVPKCNTPASKVQRRPSNAFRNSSEHSKSSNTSINKSQLQNNNQNEKDQNIAALKVSGRGKVIKTSNLVKNVENSRQLISQKLKAISSLLEIKSPDKIDYDSGESSMKFNDPDPSESFSKAKEILNYLNIRTKELELMKETRDFVHEFSENGIKLEGGAKVRNQIINEAENRDFMLGCLTSSDQVCASPSMGVLAHKDLPHTLQEDRKDLDFSLILKKIRKINDISKKVTESSEFLHEAPLVINSNRKESQGDKQTTDKYCQQHRTGHHIDEQYLQIWHKQA